LPQHTSTRQSPNTAGAADGQVPPPDVESDISDDVDIDVDVDTEPTPGDAIAMPAGAGVKAEAEPSGTATPEPPEAARTGTGRVVETPAEVGKAVEAPAAMAKAVETPAEATTETGSAAAKPRSAENSEATDSDAETGAGTEADASEAPGSKAADKATGPATAADADGPATAPDLEPAGVAAADPGAEADVKVTAHGADADPEIAAPDAEVADSPEAEAGPEADADASTATEPEADADPKVAEADADAEASAPEVTPAPVAPASDTTPVTTPRPTRPGPRAWSSRLGLRRRLWSWREKHPVAARVVSWTVTVLAAVVVYVCLLMPTTLNSLKPTEFMRLPAEAILGAVVLMSLPRRPRIVLAAFSGALTAVVAILNMLDMGFNEYLGRGFNVVLDWSLFGDARGYLSDTLGGTVTSVLTVGVILFVLLLIVLVALATVRLSNLLAGHKAQASRGALIAGTVWIACTALGLQVSGVPLAADHTAAILKLRTVAIRNTLRDEAEFEKVAKVDAFGNTPGSQLVPDLRGKDMIFTFIESYGRSAIEDPIMAPGVDETLAADTKALSKAGFAAKSGWLTSATYGGSSWLGHSTTMSGLWVNNQQRYRTVMASDHLSLTDAFKKTGDFDTVGVMPGVQKGWPEQSFYGLDKVYNAFQLGYKGPKFSWSTMPDQYALEQFQKQVHSKPRTDGKSLMSMIILTSSHQPWAPIPKLVPWDQLGNGSIFDAIEKAGNKASDVIADTTKSRQEYGKSIQYSVNSLTQWLERYGNDNTVLVFLGDHQPIARVSGNHASRDVPISIVAKDPKVLAKIDSWNWTDGLRPAHDAPVWKMSAFRDKFLTAYGSTPHPKTN